MIKNRVISLLDKRLEQTYLGRKIKKYWKVLIFIVVMGYIYAVIHDLLHYFLINHFRYDAKICWFCIPTKVILLTPLEQILKNHYFFIAILPYLISAVLLMALLLLFIITKRRFLILFAFVPFLDTVTNIIAVPLAYITKEGDDF